MNGTEKKPKTSACHSPYPAIEQPIYLLRQGDEIDQIGSVSVCFWTGWAGKKPVSCFKPTGEAKWFQNRPVDLDFQMWRKAAEIGWQYRGECGGGFYFGRDSKGVLSPLGSGGNIRKGVKIDPGAFEKPPKAPGIKKQETPQEEALAVEEEAPPGTTNDSAVPFFKTEGYACRECLCQGG